MPTECRNVTIRLLDKQLSEDEIMTRLLPDNQQITNASSHFIHFDITPSVSFIVEQAVACTRGGGGGEGNLCMGGTPLPHTEIAKITLMFFVLSNLLLKF